MVPLYGLKVATIVGLVLLKGAYHQIKSHSCHSSIWGYNTYGTFQSTYTSWMKKKIHHLTLEIEVEHSLMVQWVVGSILHGVDPLSYFSFQPVLHDWCNKSHGMCYPVCAMVHIKEPLLLIDKSSLCGGSGFHFSLSEWSLTMSDAI